MGAGAARDAHPAPRMSGSAESRHQTDGVAAGDSGLLSIEAARERLADAVVPVTAIERVALRSALGRVLALDLLSPIDVPAHGNAALDGWALRSIDLRGGSETRLHPIGTAFAEIPFEGTPGPGEAVRVMTGAVMPTACDTVVVQEAAWVDGAQPLRQQPLHPVRSPAAPGRRPDRHGGGAGYP